MSTTGDLGSQGVELDYDQFLDAIFAARPDAISSRFYEYPTKLAQTQPDNHFIKKVLGTDLNQRVKIAKVLMVGAGGIGCELIKNLLLSNFGDVHVVDLDTIDLSNLNRQFLFRHEHIKMPKAIVAKNVAQKFNTDAKITAYHANIKDADFTLEWFSRFDLVFNALDNLDARRYVNRMCLAANIPLIESGTTGFKGQVQVIKKGRTACYDCLPKETPKTFPVCTIRSTPSQPIHCIVWAKSYLMNEIYGTSEDESAFDHSQDAENAVEIEELRRESQALKDIRALVTESAVVEKLFNKVFHTDINRLLALDEMWRGKKKPTPLQFLQVKESAESVIESIQDDNGQKVWSLAENVAMLMVTMKKLGARVRAMRLADPSESATIPFDKDDEDTLNFVSAAANIRATIFNIENKSRFDIKQMAGNIIPAIATTNAITAGLVVLQAYHVLTNHWNETKEVFLTPFTPDRLLAPDRPRSANPECPVCSPVVFAVKADPAYSTLNNLVEEFLRGKLGYSGDFLVTSDHGILYDPDEDQNLPKLLKDLGIESNTFVTVVDENDEAIKVNVSLNIIYVPDCKEITPISSSCDLTIPLKPAPPSVETTTVDYDDDIIVVSNGLPGGVKRPHTDDDDDVVETVEPKKARKEESDVGDITEVVNPGVIIIKD